MATAQGSLEEKGVEVFEGYESFPLTQFSARTKKAFDSFDEALDEYYHGLQSQQASLQQHRKEQQVLKKLDKVKNDFNVRQQALEAQCWGLEGSKTPPRGSSLGSLASWLIIW